MTAPHTLTKDTYNNDKKPISIDYEVPQGWTQEHHILGIKISTIIVRNPYDWTAKCHKAGHKSTTYLD